MIFAPRWRGPSAAARPVVRPGDLGPWKPENSESEGELALHSEEERHIRNILARTRGNKRKAAAILRISRSTPDRKLRKYGVEPQQYRRD